MANVQVIVNNDTEMLTIMSAGKSLFHGNFWDFDPPSDVVSVLRKLGHEVIEEVREGEEEVDSHE